MKGVVNEKNNTTVVQVENDKPKFFYSPNLSQEGVLSTRGPLADVYTGINLSFIPETSILIPFLVLLLYDPTSFGI